ncbi:uncharacterized protein LOC113228968 isoform X2 [Hyposmocoma kahamanoa]|uniref:uncharacterized protein LOC113228968 isoform X2 n=1 Tax=Hyposmocoma kahamanoa TaxID=1477025 RepID=UPI000E6D5EF7|nr:uncharacterized protein LOC113228968 isoform X2 [Hyposmocoma kahamanoa]
MRLGATALAAALALLALLPPPARATSPHGLRPPEPDPQRLNHIKSQILSKLGLSSRPQPRGAPPRDVVRQILARAADPQPPAHAHDDQPMREVIAIAQRGSVPTAKIFFYGCW